MDQPTVTIYNRNIEYKVSFPNYEVQKRYVDAEYKYCKKIFSEYAAALSKVDRKNKKSSLEAKRVAFAKHVGYGPKRGVPKLWIKLEKQEPILA